MQLVFKTIKHVRRLIITVIGFTILLVGLLMVILPGPAFIIIPLGLAILASEFVWAKNLLKRVKTKLQNKAKEGIYDRKTE